MSRSNARKNILNAVRHSLGVTDTDTVREKTVAKRLKAHKPNLVPEIAKVSGKKAVALISEKLEGQGATVSHVDKPDQIPERIAEYLRENNLPAEFRTGDDSMLSQIPWSKASSLTRHTGRGQGDDAVTISRADTAAAETGTLFLTSGADNPTTLNFLPDTHIVVIRAKDIRGSYEDAWNILRKAYKKQGLPRTVNLVSGPSRTADIEQIIVMGAHGPRRLHVIIVG
ncbi:MAG: lactate utilization protein [Hyphomicrobiaceae bacterium]|nr:lactate utilization protein [Hyphomicrobiaceae bacterium]